MIESQTLTPWLETAGALALALLGVFVGWRSSKLPSPYWLMGYIAPLVLMLVIALARRLPELELKVPFSWLMSGRTEFAIYGMVCTMMLTTPLSRLPIRRQRFVLSVGMAIFALTGSILVFLMPALNRGALAKISTKVDRDGVCLQSTDYNCGPAAAVTALGRLGFRGAEGELAILAHTTPFAGTPPDSLCRALSERYASDGLECTLRYFHSMSELRDAGVVIALIKFGFLVDHFVTVFNFTDSEITLGDPMLGKRTLSVAEFEKVWKRVGVVLKKRH